MAESQVSLRLGSVRLHAYESGTVLFTPEPEFEEDEWSNSDFFLDPWQINTLIAFLQQRPVSNQERKQL
jgi:hypothetical protein